METTFENARVGDRVWSSVFGWGSVRSFGGDEKYPVQVRFKSGNSDISYMVSGQRDDYELRTLYWDELCIDPPERPKRKAKKIIEGWVNIYGDVTIGNIHSSIEKALFARDSVRGRVALGNPFFIHHEYESEE